MNQVLLKFSSDTSKLINLLKKLEPMLTALDEVSIDIILAESKPEEIENFFRILRGVFDSARHEFMSFKQRKQGPYIIIEMRVSKENIKKRGNAIGKVINKEKKGAILTEIKELYEFSTWEEFARAIGSSRAQMSGVKNGKINFSRKAGEKIISLLDAVKEVPQRIKDEFFTTCCAE